MDQRLSLPILFLLLLAPGIATGDCEWDFGIRVGNDCGAVPAEGCCKEGAYRYWCDNGVLCMEECYFADCGYVAFLGYQCGTLMGIGADSCPAIPSPCVVDCIGKECGDDGCGGDCGRCYGDTVCRQGRCEATCQPACAGKECGDDGCGGSCGLCGGGRTCWEGRCLLPDCTPACSGKECGDDLCGGLCGTCPEGYLCMAGRCKAPEACHPVCDGKECGPDGCDGVCGVCPRGMLCTNEGICVEEGRPCEPDCRGRSCGPDGCGGTCGICEGTLVCMEGRCVAPVPSDADDGQNAGVGDVVGTGDAKVPGSAQETLRCPEGQRLLYGSCQTVETEARSGCAAGGGPAKGLGVFLSATGFLVALLLRRRPRRT